MRPLEEVGLTSRGACSRRESAFSQPGGLGRGRAAAVTVNRLYQLPAGRVAASHRVMTSWKSRLARAVARVLPGRSRPVGRLAIPDIDREEKSGSCPLNP